MPLSQVALPASILSDIGKQRTGRANEDTGAMVELSQGGLYAVADGMGGHAAGEMASQLAIQTLTEYYLKDKKSPPERLARAVQQANLSVLQHAVGEYAGMGTTLVALVIDRGVALVAHVGDSRAYLRRGHQLYRLTEDHSWVAEQIRVGKLTEEAARTHQWRSVVSNALGGEEQVRLELYGFALRAGDRLLLCSDGLSGVVEEADLYEMLSWQLEPEQLVQQLIDAANTMGGPDNITAVVIDIPTTEGLPRYKVPGRRKDGPIYLDAWLSQQRDTYLFNYISLLVVYIVLMGLLLIKGYAMYILVAGFAALSGLYFINEQRNKAALNESLPPALDFEPDLPPVPTPAEQAQEFHT